MNGSFDLTIGSQVMCGDGVCGALTRVVVDPFAHALKHLVVSPRFQRGPARLVPVDLVDFGADEIRLRCTRAEFEELEEAKETHYRAGGPGESSDEQDQMLSLPYYRLAPSAPNWGLGSIKVSWDRVPAGEVEVHRGDKVHATDGVIGRVLGLGVDPGDDHVPYLLLDEGHLWGAKRVVIPISAVKGADDGVRLALTKDQVGDLPAAEPEPKASRTRPVN